MKAVAERNSGTCSPSREISAVILLIVGLAERVRLGDRHDRRVNAFAKASRVRKSETASAHRNHVI